MSHFETLRTAVIDEWGLAIVLGLATIPFSALGYLQSSGTVSLTPVLVAGLIAGICYRRRPQRSARAGAVTGLVGAAPIVWFLNDVFVVLGFVSELSQPAWFSALQVVAAASVLVFGVLFAVLVGMVGGAVGNWLAGITGGRRSLPAGN